MRLVLLLLEIVRFSSLESSLKEPKISCTKRGIHNKVDLQKMLRQINNHSFRKAKKFKMHVRGKSRYFRS